MPIEPSATIAIVDDVELAVIEALAHVLDA